MKTLVLGEKWINARMKAIRFSLITLPGRIVRHARELIVRLTGGHDSTPLLIEIRRKILDTVERRMKGRKMLLLYGSYEANMFRSSEGIRSS